MDARQRSDPAIVWVGASARLRLRQVAVTSLGTAVSQERPDLGFWYRIGSISTARYDVAQLILMVDRALDDGRFVAINDSHEDAVVGTIFVEMTVMASELIEGEFKSVQIGSPTAVGLRLDSVESWRRSMDAVPLGHNAAIQLSGAGLNELRAQLARKSKGLYVFLASD